MPHTHIDETDLREEAADLAEAAREDDSGVAEERQVVSASPVVPENDDFPRELDSAWPAQSASGKREPVGDAHAKLSEDDRASVEIGLDVDVEREDGRRDTEFEAAEARAADDDVFGLNADERLEEPSTDERPAADDLELRDEEPREAGFAPVFREVSDTETPPTTDSAHDDEPPAPVAEAAMAGGEPILAEAREHLPVEPIEEVPNELERELETAEAGAQHGLGSDDAATEQSDAREEASDTPFAEDFGARESSEHAQAERAEPEHAAPRALEVHATRASKPEAYVRPGLFSRLFGGGQRSTDDRGIVHFEQKPGLLRVFARREYQRDAALASIRSGFNDLSGLMRDIRDGLHASVEKQGELLDHLKYLPVVAEQNQQSAQRFEEQALAQNRLQMETIHAIREQIRGQHEQTEQVSRVLSTIGREARDHKREIDDLEQRLARMRESDEAISSNLCSVGTAVRNVAEQGSAHSELVLRMQEAMEARTRQMEELMRRQAGRQGLFLALSVLLGVAALSAVAVIGYLYLRSTGAI